MLRRTPLALVSLSLGACYSQPTWMPPPGGASEPPGELADAGALEPEAEFDTRVAPMLTAACAPCHAQSGGIGPGFLEPRPTMLASLLAYPYLIGRAPESSRLYTKGAHHGSPGLDGDQALLLAEWIVHWNATLATTAPGPSQEPFEPLPGPWALDLGPLGLPGQEIRGRAAVEGESLILSELVVRSAGAAGLHLVHPLWVRWVELAPHPDPADSFAGLELRLPAGAEVPLGPGLLVLPYYQPGQKISVCFSRLERLEEGR